MNPEFYLYNMLAQAADFWSFNVGQVVSWVVLALVGAAGLERLRANVRGHEETIRVLATDVKRLQLEGSPPNSSAIAVILGTQAQQSVRLEGQQTLLNNIASLKNDIEWIRRALDELRNAASRGPGNERGQ
jgi:hypothetical protein